MEGLKMKDRNRMQTKMFFYHKEHQMGDLKVKLKPSEAEDLLCSCSDIFSSMGYGWLLITLNLATTTKSYYEISSQMTGKRGPEHMYMITCIVNFEAFQTQLHLYTKSPTPSIEYCEAACMTQHDRWKELQSKTDCDYIYVKLGSWD